MEVETSGGDSEGEPVAMATTNAAADVDREGEAEGGEGGDGVSTTPPRPSNGHQQPALRVADEQELRAWLESGSTELTPSVRGVLAETAATGFVRYDWNTLLLPLYERALDSVLDDFEAAEAEAEEEEEERWKESEAQKEEQATKAPSSKTSSSPSHKLLPPGLLERSVPGESASQRLARRRLHNALSRAARPPKPPKPEDAEDLLKMFPGAAAAATGAAGGGALSPLGGGFGSGFGGGSFGFLGGGGSLLSQLLMPSSPPAPSQPPSPAEVAAALAPSFFGVVEGVFEDDDGDENKKGEEEEKPEEEEKAKEKKVAKEDDQGEKEEEQEAKQEEAAKEEEAAATAKVEEAENGNTSNDETPTPPPLPAPLSTPPSPQPASSPPAAVAAAPAGLPPLKPLVPSSSPTPPPLRFHLPPPPEPREPRSETRERLRSYLRDHDAEPPFTIQRLSEILLVPRPQWRSLGPLARALERVLLVTTPWRPSSSNSCSSRKPLPLLSEIPSKINVGPPRPRPKPKANNAFALAFEKAVEANARAREELLAREAETAAAAGRRESGGNLGGVGFASAMEADLADLEELDDGGGVGVDGGGGGRGGGGQGVATTIAEAEPATAAPAEETSKTPPRGATTVAGSPPSPPPLLGSVQRPGSADAALPGIEDKEGAAEEEEDKAEGEGKGPCVGEAAAKSADAASAAASSPPGADAAASPPKKVEPSEKKQGVEEDTAEPMEQG